MTTSTPAREKVKIKEISESVKKRIPKKETNSFTTLISSFFSHISTDDLENYKDDDLKGLIETLYRYVQTPPKDKTTLFNPNVEEHGWQSPHTILLLHHADIRYLIDSIRNTLNQKHIKIHNVFHAYVSVERNKDGSIKTISEQDKASQDKSADELLLYVEIDEVFAN